MQVFDGWGRPVPFCSVTDRSSFPSMQLARWEGAKVFARAMECDHRAPVSVGQALEGCGAAVQTCPLRTYRPAAVRSGCHPGSARLSRHRLTGLWLVGCRAYLLPADLPLVCNAGSVDPAFFVSKKGRCSHHVLPAGGVQHRPQSSLFRLPALPTGLPAGKVPLRPVPACGDEPAGGKPARRTGSVRRQRPRPRAVVAAIDGRA